MLTDASSVRTETVSRTIVRAALGLAYEAHPAFLTFTSAIDVDSSVEATVSEGGLIVSGTVRTGKSGGTETDTARGVTVTMRLRAVALAER